MSHFLITTATVALLILQNHISYHFSPPLPPLPPPSYCRDTNLPNNFLKKPAWETEMDPHGRVTLARPSEFRTRTEIEVEGIVGGAASPRRLLAGS